MFFKPVFSLYSTAIALAASKGGLVDVGDIPKLRVVPILCIGLSNLDVDDNDIIKGLANVDVADVFWRHGPSQIL